MMHFDDALQHAGAFGFYQKRIVLAICLANIPTAFHVMAQVFLAGSATFWCTAAEFEAINCPSSWNLTASQCDEAKYLFLVPTKDESCLRYTNVTTATFAEGVDPTNWPIGQCDDWVYDMSQYKSTIIQEWDLVCGDTTKPAIAQSLFTSGVLVGSLFVGSLADRCGRKPALFGSIVVQCLSGVAASLSANYVVFVCFRFLTGVGSFGALSLSFVISTEWVGPSYRKFVAIYTAVMWAVGYMLLALLAYFIRTWRTLAMVTSLSGLVLLTFYPFTPESARWLLCQHKIDETMRALRKAAHVNGKSYDNQEQFTDFGNYQSGTIFDLFKTPNLRKNTLTMMFNWFAISCVYYGLSLGTSELGANDYIVFWISGVVEVPACILVMLIVDSVGRRWSLCSSMLLGGVACILTLWTPKGPWMVTTAMIGKFSVSFAFALVYLFAAEIFPTPVRGIGVGISSTSAIVGGIIAPLLLEIKKLWRPLHLVCFCALSITAGLLALLLPESSGQQLPETLEEGENFGKYRKTVAYDVVELSEESTNNRQRRTV